MVETHINVTFTGQEYMQYKAKDKIVLSKKTKNFLIYTSPFFIGALVLFAIFVSMTDHDYAIAHPTHYVNFHGFDIPSQLLTVLLVSIMVGWVIHGVGFFIVKG